MVEIILGVAAVLILIVLLLFFRINTLLSVMKGTYTKRAGTSNRINGFLMLVFLLGGLFLFYWSAMSASKNYLPRAVSLHGVRTDNLFWLTMMILTFAFVVTNIFLMYFAYKYQYKEGRKAYFYPDNHKLEIVWTIIPGIVMAILVYFGWKEWTAITQAEPSNSEVVEVMGKQFAWQVRYPGKDGQLGGYSFKLIDASNEFGVDFKDKYSFDDFMPSEIHIPKGQPILFKIRARDVLHSVFAPHFRLKMDAVPGMPTRFWFTPTKTTQEMRDDLGNPEFNYELACTEVCGRGHFAMRFLIFVDEPEDYQKWYASQKTFTDLNKDYVASKAPKSLWHLISPADADSTAAPIQNTSLPADTMQSDTSKVSNLQALQNNY